MSTSEKPVPINTQSLRTSIFCCSEYPSTTAPSDRVTKWAYNASFERVCLSVWLRRNYPEHFHSYSIPGDPVQNYLDPASWKCTLVWAAYNGLPLGLEKVGAVLGFEEQKLKEGKDLIKYFCCPCKPTKSNGGRTWNLPHHAPEKWELFKKYNERDVQVEMQIQERLKNYPVPDFVWDEYHLDQQIMRHAVPFRTADAGHLLIGPFDLIIGAIDDKLHGPLPRLCRPWTSWHLAEVLSLRLQLAKSSVRKYQAMQNAVCADGRCHGMFQFYGANRSGRWAGRLIQLQNLPQNHMDDLEQARDLVKAGDYEMLDMLYDSVPGVLSELIRTAPSFLRKRKS